MPLASPTLPSARRSRPSHGQHRQRTVTVRRNGGKGGRKRVGTGWWRASKRGRSSFDTTEETRPEVSAGVKRRHIATYTTRPLRRIVPRSVQRTRCTNGGCSGMPPVENPDKPLGSNQCLTGSRPRRPIRATNQARRNKLRRQPLLFCPRELRWHACCRLSASLQTEVVRHDFKFRCPKPENINNTKSKYACPDSANTDRAFTNRSVERGRREYHEMLVGT